MTEIKLYNTKTRKKEVFQPLDPENVRMYVCGPTVYDRAHLGNARPVIVFDVLFRLLRHVYGKDHVTYVRNFTDVDDKIIARAVENVGASDDLNAEIAQLTKTTTQWYLDDMRAVAALDPTEMPRATAYIDQMQTMIATLVDKGFAYVVRTPTNNPPEEFVLADREAMLGAHALFEVEKFERYGELSKRATDKMLAEARIEKAPYKRSELDFVLWKPSTAEQPGWDSPWGRGRPGWHIECSAMAKALLGDTFDIHGGGRDLMFPHHENEVAQSCCANDTNEMARVWMHNEMLQVEGKKMSKSLGNFFTVRDLLDQGVPGEVIRLVMLSTHYRKPMDWTEKKRQEAEATLVNWRNILAMLGEKSALTVLEKPLVDERVVQALADDLNSPKAIAVLHDLGRSVLKGDAVSGQKLFGSALFLGLDLNVGSRIDNLLRFGAESVEQRQLQQRYEPLVLELIERRRQARETKDYAEADKLRDRFSEAGVYVADGPNGTMWSLLPNFDPAKLEALK